MYSNSTSNMNINTNGNIVRTKIKLTDAKGIHIATFATGNGWSDGKCSEAFLIGGIVDLDGKPTKIVGILPAPKAVLKGAVNDTGDFIISHSFMEELYGFWNSPVRDVSLTEKDMKRIETARKAKGSRFELIKSQKQIKKEAVLALAIS